MLLLDLRQRQINDRVLRTILLVTHPKSLFHPSTRYNVKMPDGSILALKADNLNITIDKIKLVNLQSQPQLNGKEGNLFDYDPVKDR